MSDSSRPDRNWIGLFERLERLDPVRIIITVDSAPQESDDAVVTILEHFLVEIPAAAARGEWKATWSGRWSATVTDWRTFPLRAIEEAAFHLDAGHAPGDFDTCGHIVRANEARWDVELEVSAGGLASITVVWGPIRSKLRCVQRLFARREE